MRRLGPGRESLGEEAGGRDTERTGTEEDGGGGGGVCDGGGGTAIITTTLHKRLRRRRALPLRLC